VGLARSGGAVVGWQAGSAAECEAAEAAGCSYVTIQGVEAGGHVCGTQRLDEALEQTLAAVDVPVVAAGGIGTAERVHELLAAGASAVRFVAAEESDAHPAYAALLIRASRHDTVLTGAFANGWPDAPHRVLVSAVMAAERFAGRTVATLGERELPAFARCRPRGRLKAKWRRWPCTRVNRSTPSPLPSPRPRSSPNSRQLSDRAPVRTK